MARIGNVEIKEAAADVTPKCPYCKLDLEQIWSITKGTGFIGKEQILVCPHCRAFLGYTSYRR